MSDSSEPFPNLPTESEAENKLLSDRYEELLEALEVFYIKDNISGRLGFLKDWPDVAAHILGEELIGFDTDGTDDRERRSTLEEEAEERRIELLEIAQSLESKSVIKGALQKEYVEPLIKRWGRDFALLLYSENIVDRFILPPEPEPETEENAAEAAAEAAANMEAQPVTPAAPIIQNQKESPPEPAPPAPEEQPTIQKIEEKPQFIAPVEEIKPIVEPLKFEDEEEKNQNNKEEEKDEPPSGF